MSKAVLYMSMSVDGFIADENDYLGGADDQRLHDWFAPGGEFTRPDGPVGELLDELTSCGAVVAGRRTAEWMDHWGGDHNGLPIFVPSHRPAPPPARWQYPKVTYVADGIESAVAQARDASGDRDVYLVGGYTARTAPQAGVLDELQIHQVPVLLGRGRRLFGELPSYLELEIVRVIDTPRSHPHPIPRHQSTHP